jgi:hypothetical protein
MKAQIFSKALMAGLGIGAFFLASCETSQDRITKHPEIYQSLSPRDQQLVSQGQIRSGMTQSAVWLAWGEADQKVQGEMRGRPTETWIYTNTEEVPGYAYGPYGPGYGGGPYGGGYGYGYGYPGFGGGVIFRNHRGRFAIYGDPFYDPFYYSWFPPTITYPYKVATFSGGRLRSFQRLVPPRAY